MPTPVALVSCHGPEHRRAHPPPASCSADRTSRAPISCQWAKITDRWDLRPGQPNNGFAEEIKTANQSTWRWQEVVLDDLDSLVIALRSSGSSLGLPSPVEEVRHGGHGEQAAMVSRRARHRQS